MAIAWFSSMKNNKIKVNTAKGKTDFMHIGRRRQELYVQMEREKIHQVESYLGMVVDEGNRQETDINARIGKYIKTFT